MVKSAQSKFRKHLFSLLMVVIAYIFWFKPVFIGSNWLWSFIRYKTLATGARGFL